MARLAIILRPKKYRMTLLTALRCRLGDALGAKLQGRQMPTENARRPERKPAVQNAKSEADRLKRSTGISESQALTLVHCMGTDREMLRRAAMKLATFGK